jgi:ribosomal protein S3
MCVDVGRIEAARITRHRGFTPGIVPAYALAASVDADVASAGVSS